MDISAFLLDAMCAAIAAIGFSAISNPPVAAYRYVAVIAALGHVTRFALMNCVGWNIVPASLVGALLIGMVAILSASRVRCVPEALSYPALLPMIPGIYAYRCIQAVGMMLISLGEREFMHYSYLALFNGLTASFVILAMFVGQLVPVALLDKKVYSATRGTIS